MSIAGAAAAEARRQAISNIGAYNLRVGPTYWKFSSGLGVEYNSNVDNSAHDPDGDLIFRPEVDLRLLWPLTEHNRLDLNVGVGYSAYVTRSDLDRFFLSPGTGLSFDVAVGDFLINFHDRISLTQDAYQDPTVTGTGDYARLENSAGVSALWDLNKVKLRMGYDHVNYVSFGTNNVGDGLSDVVSCSLSYMLKPQVAVGLELGGGLVEYGSGSSNQFTTAKQWNAGAFCETPLTEYISVRASAGYSAHLPDNEPDLPNGGEFTGVYGQLSVSHRLNEYVQYSLSAGRSIDFALFGGVVDHYFARWQGTLKVFRLLTPSISLDYDHGADTGTGTETFDRYGAQISIARPLTKKLSSSLSYQFYWRDSNIPSGDYFVNVVTLHFTYNF